MKTKLELQNDVLNELVDYSPKIIYGTKELIGELKDNRQEDTDALFGLVIKGINWVIEVFNACEKRINEKDSVVDKNGMSAAVTRLQEVLRQKDDKKIANCLQDDFLPFLETMDKAANQLMTA